MWTKHLWVKNESGYEDPPKTKLHNLSYIFYLLKNVNLGQWHHCTDYGISFSAMQIQNNIMMSQILTTVLLKIQVIWVYHA